MRWQHLLHAKCFKVGILPFKTSLYFFLWKFQMQCFLFFSSLEHPPPCACEFLFFYSFFTFFFFFFLGQQLLSFSLSHAALSSLSLEKKRSKLYGETRNGRSESGKRKMQRVIERHARRRRFNHFFKNFFYCCDLNRENRERFLDPAGSTVVWTVSCFLCIERFFGFKEPDCWEGHG